MLNRHITKDAAPPIQHVAIRRDNGMAPSRCQSVSGGMVDFISDLQASGNEYHFEKET